MSNLIHGASNSPGPYGASVGWVDFTSYGNLSVGQSVNVVCTEPGVGTLTFTLVSKGPISKTEVSGPAKIGSAYYALSGNVGYGSTRDNRDSITIEINNINYVGLNNSPIPYFEVLMMDNETTVSGEYWQVTTNGSPWKYEGIVPIGASMGDPAVTGLNTQTYRQTGITNGSGNTSPIISTIKPTQIIFSSQNNATQIFTLGVYIPASESITKAVDKKFTDFGDTITYTIVISNPSFVRLTNTRVFDTIPAETTYIPGSLLVNNIPNNGDIEKGLFIGTIPQLSNVTISFKVVVSESITKSIILNNSTMSYTGSGSSTSKKSNDVTTTILKPRVFIRKNTDVMIARLGDEIIYSLTVGNYGTTKTNNTMVIDTILGGTVFIPGSVTVNGITQPSGTIEPPTGLNIGSVDVNATKTITFKVSVVTVPIGDEVINNFVTKYTYVSIPNGKDINVELISNNTTIPVRFVDIDNILKEVDKTVATSGDTITYTIMIQNKGNQEAINSVFIDTLPQGSIYINKTLLVNGTPSDDPITAINIGTIPAYGMLTISFKVRVI